VLLSLYSSGRELFKDTLPGSCQGKHGYLILDLYYRLWPDTLMTRFLKALYEKAAPA
jgi:hypothetical protein